MNVNNNTTGLRWIPGAASCFHVSGEEAVEIIKGRAQISYCLLHGQGDREQLTNFTSRLYHEPIVIVHSKRQVLVAYKGEPYKQVVSETLTKAVFGGYEE